MDISLEIFFFRQLYYFVNDSLLAPASHLSSLMVCESAEAAAAEAATGTYNAEFDFLKSGYSAHLIIHGMPLVFKRQAVNVVQLFPFQRRLGWILNHINCVSVLFCQSHRRYAVVIFKLHCEASGVSLLIRRYFIKGRKHLKAFPSCAFRYGKILRSVTRSSHPGYIPCRNSRIKCFSDFNYCPLAHAVNKKVCFGIQQD